MTTHDRDRVIAAAKEAGSSIVGGDNGTDTQCWTGDIAFTDEALAAFYAIAFESGRQAEREECAKVCESIDSLASSNPPILCAKAIRARGDTK